MKYVEYMFGASISDAPDIGSIRNNLTSIYGEPNFENAGHLFWFDHMVWYNRHNDSLTSMHKTYDGGLQPNMLQDGFFVSCVSDAYARWKADRDANRILLGDE